MSKKQKNLLVRVILAGVIMALLVLLPLERWVPASIYPVVRFCLFLIPYLIVGCDILRKAVKGILNRQVFDEHFLMGIATIGAMVLGEYTEGVAVMWFYQIGELFQSYAVGKSRQNISALMDIRPDYANVMEDGELVKVDPDDVEIGTVIYVQPGEKVPIDGNVVDGESSVDTSALTGESVPVHVGVGSSVISGSVNLSGLLQIETTCEFDESTASKILDLVENATSRKARSEQFITKFARVYTPAVCYSALALAVLPPLVRLVLGMSPMWSDWIYRALTFLVISCPCAIVVSIPLSFFGGIGGASRDGILIKGSNYRETLASVRTVVFDKTGTMTKGNFEVVEVRPAERKAESTGGKGTAGQKAESTGSDGKAGFSERELLHLAAAAESYSTHPIAESLRRAEKELQKDLDESQAVQAETADEISDVMEIAGRGVTARVDGRSVAVGNHMLMNEITDGAADIPAVESGAGTTIYVAVDGAFAGSILIADELKETAKDAVTALKMAGVAKTVMLTGDVKPVAEYVASEIGVDEVYAGLMPADKVSHVEQLLGAAGGEALAFVGDGINDAPVLARADIGIAMGALGSDAAIEAADVVLMDDDPLKIAKAIRIARKCIRIVYENIWFAIGVKLLCLLLGALGIANMWLAIFADVGVMVLCVLNAIRCLAVKRV